MAINKVIYYGEVLVDMSQVSVSPDSLVSGKTALDASGELISGANPYEKSATDEEVSSQTDLIAEIASALEGKAVGVAAEPTIGKVSVRPSSNTTSISFTGVAAEPKMFSICPTGNISLGSTRYVPGVMYDGETTHGTYGYRSGSSATSYYSASYFTWAYRDGTLTVTTSSSTNGGNFRSGVTYQLVYVA